MKEEGRDEHEIKKMGEVLQVDSLLCHNFLKIKYDFWEKSMFQIQ
jgi:hypothetical protein